MRVTKNENPKHNFPGRSNSGDRCGVCLRSDIADMITHVSFASIGSGVSPLQQ